MALPINAERPMLSQVEPVRNLSTLYDTRYLWSGSSKFIFWFWYWFGYGFCRHIFWHRPFQTFLLTAYKHFNLCTGSSIKNSTGNTKQSFVTVKTCGSSHLNLLFVMLYYGNIVSGSKSVSESAFSFGFGSAKTFGFFRTRIRIRARDT
jgi:hypothetical protein